MSVNSLISVDVKRMVVIPVEEFEEYCKRNHYERDAGFEEEYEVTAGCGNVISSTVLMSTYTDPGSRAAGSPPCVPVTVQQTQEQIWEHLPM